MKKLKIELQKQNYKTQNIIYRHPTPKPQQQQLTLQQSPTKQQKHQTSVHTPQQQQFKHTLQKQQIAPPNITRQTSTNITIQHNPTFLTKYQGYEIWEKDLQTLDDGRFLNDIVINVMLAWTKKEIVTGQRMNQVCICNSHWFEELRRGKGATNTEAMQENLQVMRKWYPQGTPFSAPIAVIPVCHNLHWVGFVVTKENNTLNIWGLDSLGTKTLNEVRPILEKAITICHPTMELAYKPVSVTPQTNGSDCGVLLLHNVIRALQHLTKTKVPDVIGMEIAITNSPGIGRKEIREQLRAICQGRTHPHDIFNIDPTADLLAELELSDEEDEVITPGHIIGPHSQAKLEDEITIENATSESLKIMSEMRVYITELTELARKIVASGKRRAIFTREFQGYQFRVTGRGSGMIKIRCDK